MENNIKIGLVGMYGLYNYGCEAIVRGTYELIKKAWPNCKVILYTHCPKEDQEILYDLNILVKCIPENNLLIIRRVINKILRAIKIYKQIEFYSSKKLAIECDIIFSVGGDIYTIPKNIIDNNKIKKYHGILEIGKNILKYKPFVIWGASIGPFGEKEEIKNYFFEHFKNVNKIFCREEDTVLYLKNNGVDSNIEICADPAFYIRNIIDVIECSKSDKVRIALNLSPLSIIDLVGDNNNVFQNEIIDTIIELSNIPNSEIILIPHVVSRQFEKDNDLTYLKNIFELLPDSYREKVSIQENLKGFLGTKAFLITCDVVIAARMHCAINAVCEGIPTIFLIYSQKALGMAKYIYGDTKWAIPLLDIKKELKNRTIEMIYNRHNISDNIKKRIERIRSDEYRIISLFRKLV